MSQEGNYNYNPPAFDGDLVGPNGTWYTYSLQSNGNVWSTYVDGVLFGSVNLGVSNSGGNTPSAHAEVPGTLTTQIILGPVEFRDLAYRDTNNVWYNVSSATAYIGYGVGSDTVPSDAFPYGIQLVGVNDWLAGTGPAFVSQAGNGQLLWVGSRVIPEFPITQLPVLILCLTLVSILVRKKPRVHM